MTRVVGAFPLHTKLPSRTFRIGVTPVFSVNDKKFVQVCSRQMISYLEIFVPLLGLHSLYGFPLNPRKQ